MERAEELIGLARAETGLESFGEDSFREGLTLLVTSLDRDSRLNEVGKASMDAQIVSFLAHRLRIEDWYARHPEIDEQEIVAPLVGIGLPRTGSTALACLLGEDTNARSLRTWESLAPCPPPQVATMASDPRIALAEAAMESRARLFPRMTSMLPTTAKSPAECQTFMGYDFKSKLFESFAEIPTYVDWLDHKADLRPTYRYVKRVLKLLQWRCPTTRWRLKNPAHSLFINHFNAVFPDARFVMTHRDIANVIVSVSDLQFELAKPYSHHVDKQAIGRRNAQWCYLGMRRTIDFRDSGADERFFDIHFEAFQRDPLATIQKLYDWLGEALGAEARANMEAWRRATPRDESYQRTDAQEFCLDPTALRERFRFYTERFPPPLGEC